MKNKSIKTMILGLALFTSPAFALVGDEQCTKMGHYEETLRSRNAVSGWNCDSHHSNGEFGSFTGYLCKRNVSYCIEYGVSPSQMQAKLIGEAVSAQLYEGAKKSIDVNMDAMRVEIVSLRSAIHQLAESVSKEPNSRFKNRK